MNAYLLRFDTGEYSDRSDRTVCVYADRKLASLHCALANNWLKVRKLHWDDEQKADWDERQHLLCPYDPDLNDLDYTGGLYTVVEVVCGCEDALNRMRAVADGGNDPGFADWIEEYSWTEDANKFRGVPK